MGIRFQPSVHVKIHGVEYSVTGYDDGEYLQEVAEFVDQRMRLLSQMQSDIPPLKNAILTALNLADELLQARKQLAQHHEEAAGFSREVADRSRKLAELCSQV